MHVYQPQSQVCKPGESLALRKVQHPHNGRTSVNRFPLTKQDILSQYSGCFVTSESKEEIMEIAEIAEIAEDAPAEEPAPAPTLETVEE